MMIKKLLIIYFEKKRLLRAPPLDTRYLAANLKKNKGIMATGSVVVPAQY